MADSFLREMLVLLGVEDDGANEDVQAFGESLDELESRAGDLVGTLATLGAALAAVGAAAIAQAVSTAGYAEEVLVTADALGVSTDALQAYTYAADKAGLTTEDLAAVFQKIGTSAAKAEDGGKALTAAYAELGLDAARLDGLAPDERIAAIADALAAAKNPADRLTAATRIFGAGLAQKVIPLLAGGSAGLAEMALAAKRSGYVLSHDALEAGDRFNDSIEDMSLLLTAVRNRVGSELIPAMTELAEKFLDWWDLNHELIGLKIDEYVGRIGDAFTDAGAAVEYASDRAGGAEGLFDLLETLASLAAGTALGVVAYRVGAIGTALWGVVKAAAVASPTIQYLWTAFTTGGLPYLVTALGTVAEALLVIVGGLGSAVAFVALWALAMEDVYTYLTGGESVFGRVVARLKEMPGALGAVGRLLEAYAGVFASLGNLAGTWIDTMVGGLSAALTLAEPLLSVFLRLAEVIGTDLVGALASALDRLVPLLDGATALLGGASGAIDMSAAGMTAGAVASSAYLPSATAAAAGGTSRSVTVGGDQITITGVGISKEEVEELLRQRASEKNRATIAAASGTDI